VPLDERAQLERRGGVEQRRLDELGVQSDVQHAVRIPDVRTTPGHPGREVASHRAEHDHGPVRHVLAAVVADTLDDGDGTRVAHREALAGTARAIELSAGRSVEDGVAHEARFRCSPRGRRDDDATAAHALADVVVRLAFEVELDAGGEEGAEALAGRADEARAHPPGWRALRESPPDQATQPGADRPVGVRDAIGGLD
jgi:hypothetical protein